MTCNGSTPLERRLFRAPHEGAMKCWFMFFSLFVVDSLVNAQDKEVTHSSCPGGRTILAKGSNQNSSQSASWGAEWELYMRPWLISYPLVETFGLMTHNRVFRIEHHCREKFNNMSFARWLEMHTRELQRRFTGSCCLCIRWGICGGVRNYGKCESAYSDLIFLNHHIQHRRDPRTQVKLDLRDRGTRRRPAERVLCDLSKL